MASNTLMLPDDWKSSRFRQNVVTRIEEAIQQSGNPTTKTASEMETHFFQRARNKEEYFNFLARLLIHIKELSVYKARAQGGGVTGQVNFQPNNPASEDWKSPGFRQNVVDRIEGAIRQTGNPSTKTAREMETHFFQRANNPEEYLNYLARLLIHIRELAQGVGVSGYQGNNPSNNPATGSDDWKSPEFRQHFVAKMEIAIHQSGIRIPTTMRASEMETRVFRRSKNKEEYLKYFSEQLMNIKDLGVMAQAIVLSDNFLEVNVQENNPQQQGNIPQAPIVRPMNYSMNEE